ncbi:2',3'-cyclic-nucleotide 3'-phosphodiesterase [Trichomonascus vanleenenianus]|uniref:2',3'-cyclic-nucleotide 3'-phosphodiesterase n=1 Tax=Trichomonascus vanleenenianus TaxID=2268995 RepID=UPI003ECB4418
MGVALWLMPKKNSPLYDALQSTINGLTSLFDDAEGFAPHVTLTSDIVDSMSQAHVDYILDRALAASKAVPHIDVVFDTLTYGPSFLRKVYFQVEPSSALISLAQICREEFVYLPRLITEQKNYNALSDEDKQRIDSQASKAARDWIASDFKPHLSLVYSDTYPIDEALQRTIETRLSDVFGPDFNNRGLGWTNGRIALVSCEGPIDSWQELGYRDI